MIFDLEAGFCFLANTKCASTTIETSIPNRRRMLRFKANPFKHTNFRQFSALCDAYGFDIGKIETVCIIRDPLDRASSWYRFRQREGLLQKGRTRGAYTGSMSFDEYLQNQIRLDAQGRRAQIRQLPFVTDRSGNVGVTRIFTMDRVGEALDYIAGRLDFEGEFESRNQSKVMDLEISPDVEREFRDAFSDEFEFYARYTAQ